MGIFLFCYWKGKFQLYRKFIYLEYLYFLTMTKEKNNNPIPYFVSLNQYVFDFEIWLLHIYNIFQGFCFLFFLLFYSQASWKSSLYLLSCQYLCIPQPTALKWPCLSPKSTWASVSPWSIFSVAKSRGYVPILSCLDLLVVSHNIDLLLLTMISSPPSFLPKLQVHPDSILCSLLFSPLDFPFR